MRGQGPDVSQRITLLVSPRIHGAPTASHLAAIFEQSLAALQIDPAQAPNIVFLYADSQSAQVQHVPTAAKIMVARIGGTPAPVWHIWILSDPSDGAAFQGILMALNGEFDLKMTKENIATMREQLSKVRRNTVSASELLSHK
jgi:hypothetical protein